MGYRGKVIELLDADGEPIQEAKKVFDGICKKAVITKMSPSNGKVVIEYRSKKGQGTGRAELYDIKPK